MCALLSSRSSLFALCLRDVAWNWQATSEGHANDRPTPEKRGRAQLFWKRDKIGIFLPLLPRPRGAFARSILAFGRSAAGGNRFFFQLFGLSLSKASPREIGRVASDSRPIVRPSQLFKHDLGKTVCYESGLQALPIPFKLLRKVLVCGDEYGNRLILASLSNSFGLSLSKESEKSGGLQQTANQLFARSDTRPWKTVSSQALPNQFRLNFY